ncbi:hypothetical protein LL946_02120 [Knoellia locipacati]|uniref:hypothetical protein n=1 Tax=Knoellia locipacati TaxID=882824 RepID=UPI003850A37B
MPSADFDPTQPFSGEEACEAGLRRALRDGRFRRIFHGMYIDARIPDTVVVRSRAALRLAPEGGVLSHWTAARLWGGVVPEHANTHVSFTRDVRFRVEGIKHHRFRHRLHIVRRHGLQVTGPEQTFVHLARHLNLLDLVALGDSLVRKAVTTPAGLLAYAQGWEGQCRREAVAAARLVRDHVDSVPETKLRLLLVLAGLPEPEVDIRIHDADGTVVFRIDLGYRAAKLAFEYDGRWHDEDEQPAMDESRRQYLSIEEGWRFEIFVAKDVFETPEATIERAAAALEAVGVRIDRPLSDAWRPHFRCPTAQAA